MTLRRLRPLPPNFYHLSLSQIVTFTLKYEAHPPHFRGTMVLML